MKKMAKRLLIIFIIFFILIGSFSIFSYLFFKRSAMASIMELSMKRMDYKKEDSTVEEIIKEINDIDNSDYEIIGDYDVDIETMYLEGVKYFVLDYRNTSSSESSDNNSGDSIDENVILYFHGGAYVFQLNEIQVLTAVKMARGTNAKLIIPLYPLAPKHTAIEAYDFLDKLYNNIINENPNSKIIFAGDSAGGGLALGFAEYLLDKQIKNPDKLVLISPWVDISMDNKEIDDYIDVDPMLNKKSLIVEGEMWKGSLSNKDYRVSPMYGNMQGLCDTLLFVGTRELFFPDILLLHEKLKENGVNSTLEVGENMNHVYVGYPIKEADDAMDKIIEFTK